MRLFRLCAFVVLTGAAVACRHEAGGEVLAPDPLAGLRYVNLVPDTGALDFRVIDVVQYAPNQVNAAFRTGGAVFGLTTAFLPPYSPVLAGTRSIRVFMYGTTAAVASTVMFDTTYTFEQNKNYTFYLYGYSRTGQTPKLNALITYDSVPTIPAGQFAVRVIDLASTMAGSPTGFASPSVDVFVDTLAAATTPTGTPTFSAVNFLDRRPYVFKTARPVAGAVPALNYRAAFTLTATTTPFLQADVPAGATGTSTTNPLPGELVAGTAITVILVPRSVAGSQAPQTSPTFTQPTALFIFDQLPARTAP